MEKADNEPNEQVLRDNRGARITEFYESHGLKRKEFAEMLGFKYDRLRAWEDSRAEPPAEFYTKLRELYPDADIAWLITGERSWNEEGSEEIDFPIVQDIHAGEYVVTFGDQYVIGSARSSNVKDKDVFVMRVQGNSMYPDIQEGDLAFCAPHRPFISGKIYVVINGGQEATLKRVFRRGNGYELVPTNPEFQSKFARDEEIKRLIRVVEIQRTLN